MTLEEDFGIWWNMKKYKKQDILAREYSKVEIREVNGLNTGWPGPEKEVQYWVELENGMAVGYYEPRLGKAEFPVYSIQK